MDPIDPIQTGASVPHSADKPKWRSTWNGLNCSFPRKPFSLAGDSDRGRPVDFPDVTLGNVESIGLEFNPGRNAFRMPGDH